MLLGALVLSSISLARIMFVYLSISTFKSSTFLHLVLATPSQPTMDVEFDKENITAGLDMKRTVVPSPKKAPKKTRRSIGPGVLSEGRSVPLKEDAGNRRKVGMTITRTMVAFC